MRQQDPRQESMGDEGLGSWARRLFAARENVFDDPLRLIANLILQLPFNIGIDEFLAPFSLQFMDALTSLGAGEEMHVHAAAHFADISLALVRQEINTEQAGRIGMGRILWHSDIEEADNRRLGCDDMGEGIALRNGLHG